MNNEIDERIRIFFKNESMSIDVHSSILRNVKGVDCTISNGNLESGDVILAQIISDNGYPDYIETLSGEHIQFKKYMLILGSVGYRSATREVHGIVPTNIDKNDQIDLLDASGLMGRCKSIYRGIKIPRSLKFLGIIYENGRKLNLKDFSLPTYTKFEKKSKIILVIGTSMEVGKTAIVEGLISIFIKRGCKVGVCKVTGVGRYKDTGKYIKSGATFIHDFVDWGLPSTVNVSKENLISNTTSMLAHMSLNKPDFIIIEQGEGIISDYGNDKVLDFIKNFVDYTIFCSNDLMGVVGGVNWLSDNYNFKPDIISGIVTDTIPSRKWIEKQIKIQAVNSKQIQLLEKLIVKKFLV